jgi:hypothetical protein
MAESHSFTLEGKGEKASNNQVTQGYSVNAALLPFVDAHIPMSTPCAATFALQALMPGTAAIPNW